MKMTFHAGLGARIGLIGIGALALAACGDSDNASDEVVGEDVEIVADEALDDMTDEPVEDEAVATPEPMPTPVDTQSAEERAAADREKMQDDAAAAEAAAADIMAEIESAQE